MVCEHLEALERAVLAAGIRETSRGSAWSESCREWVYFDGYLDQAAVRRVFDLPPCVVEHAHRGTHDGAERGFVCELCHDAVMGHYEPARGVPVFPHPGGAAPPRRDPP